VTRQRESRGPISVQRVALVALIQIRRSGKLGGVPVAVTIRAKLKLDLIERVFPFWHMTLPALHACVAALQRIGGGRMFLDAELRRFESFEAVTGGAVAAVGAFGELPAVRIGVMAIGALCKGDRLFKVGACMALHAIHLGVFSDQRILRL